MINNNIKSTLGGSCGLPIRKTVKATGLIQSLFLFRFATSAVAAFGLFIHLAESCAMPF